MTRAQAGSRLPAGKARSVPTMISQCTATHAVCICPRARKRKPLSFKTQKIFNVYHLDTVPEQFSTSISGSISIPISRKNEHFTQRPYRINLHADLVLYSLFLSPVHGPQRFRPIISIKQIAECTLKTSTNCQYDPCFRRDFMVLMTGNPAPTVVSYKNVDDEFMIWR